MTRPVPPGGPALAGYLADYLRVRRALGFKLEREGHLLAQFVGYLDEAGADRITVELAVAWAMLPAGADPGWHGARLAAMRGFASWLRAFDAATEVPAASVLPARSRRAIPYLYSAADITTLIDAAAGIRTPLRAATYQTLIGLLAVTGMRVGEAIRADHSDLDHHAGVLVVRDSKFGKSRHVPLHATTLAALRAYAAVRRRYCPHPATPALLVSTTGTRLIYKNVHHEFHRLTQRAGLTARSASCRPRPHDLRHTFAVQTLLEWYRAGDDVQARLPLLATYLGHTNPSDTYWYLTAAPELLALAGQRLQDHLEPPEPPTGPDAPGSTR